MAAAIPLNLPSEQMVIALINRDNNLNLSPSDVVVSEPRTNPAPTIIEGTTYVRDTLATLLAVYGGDFKENTDITYRRRDATAIFGKVTTVVRPNAQTRTVDLLSEINSKYGLALQSGDIVNEVLDISTLPVTVTIKFVDDNPAWKGSFNVTIKRLPINLPDVVTVRTLPILRYPTGQSTKIQGDLYVYAKDFTSDQEALKDLDFSSPLDGVMTILNRNVAPDVWVIRSTAANFNLYGAAVVYNGPVVDTYSTRRGFTRLLVIQLDKLCSNVAGRLLLHYNG